MLKFRPANAYWWRKQLAQVGNRTLPVELAVLARELGPRERGSWLNVRPKASGIVDLAPITPKGRSFRTRREALPLFVVAALEEIYKRAQLNRGCPELVIWRSDRETLRLVAVTNPNETRRDSKKWSADRQQFVDTARRRGVSTTVVEWQFSDDAA